MEAPRSTGLNRELNVLPLIDILLVLIIAAMLPRLYPDWRVDVQVPLPADIPTPGRSVATQAQFWRAMKNASMPPTSMTTRANAISPTCWGFDAPPAPSRTAMNAASSR